MRWPFFFFPLLTVPSISCVKVQTAPSEPAENVPVMAEVQPAPPASPRLNGDLPDEITGRIDTHFEGYGSQRIHVQLDRPLYRPGEDVWVKTWSVAARGLTANKYGQITYELINPRGQVVETKMVAQQGGTATNDFVLGDDAPGGKWTLRATLPSGEVDERPFIVSNYSAPRIRKKLEFVREAYGAGDRVEALLELEGTRGPLADHEVTALLQVAGQTVLEEKMTTDASGALLVSAKLPDNLTSSDGLLTVLVEDGGVTESISRSVPIVLAELQLAFFPEGGDLIEGLPGRVYFEATNQHGEPADVAGYITDDHGERVAEFESIHDGLGRLDLNPAPGRVYIAHISKPEGMVDGIVLPKAQKQGCTVRSFDDVSSAIEDVRVAVRCSDSREVVVAGMLRETALDAAAVKAGPDDDVVVYLHADEDLADQQGAVRVTVFDEDRQPLAERLVYRNPGKDLAISVTPDREQYGPRDEVVLSVQTTDPTGEPIEAELALAIVDDAVISMADDKEGHMLTRLYLEPELVDTPKDPGWYFDPDQALAARGLDLVMGTKGWRRFEWKQVWESPDPSTVVVQTAMRGDMVEGLEFAEEDDGAMMIPEAMPMDVLKAAKPVRKPRVREKDAEKRPMAPPPIAEPEPMAVGEEEMRDQPVMARDEAKKKEDHRGAGRRIMAAGEAVAGAVALHDLGYLEGDFEMQNRQGRAWASIRVFPKPDYSEGFRGTRTDFRDTVHWEPSLKTDASGKAELRFFLSDAVTTFRVTAEGLGAGYAGHSEATLTSVLPVSIATKLPAAVSVGDRLDLPIIATNTRSSSLTVGVSSHISSTVISGGNDRGKLTLAAGGTDTHWIPIEIGAGNETVAIHLEAEGGGLSDRIEQSLRVVPAGFPRTWSAAGESGDVSKLAFQLDDVVPHSLTASVTWHPSSVSTLMAGMEGLIRSPGGCFEQTSSTNWPNVAILSYLEAHDTDPRLRMKSAKALDAGYAKLTGYQVDAGGFETWGTGPGKEALSAFGLLQFADMQKVYPVAAMILDNDADYLLDQRNGKGGFKKTGESAHGYGSAPAAVLDGFITYALVTTGHHDQLVKELEHQAVAARTSDDPYVLALATRSLLITKHPEAEAAVERLAAMQVEDGSFPGAESSITRSYEANLLVESTALGALALMEAGTHRPAADKAAKWLVDNRQGAGTWGATQATALALSALTMHAEISKVPRTGGSLFVEVNGKRVGALEYTPEQSDPLLISGWEGALRTGENKLVLRQESGEPLPFTVDVNWTAIEPMTAPGAELSLDTTLSATKAGMGETVRLTATIENLTDRVVPSPIARIGLPAGLEPQIWQLKQLQERGEVAFYETRLREVTLYWDGIHEGKDHTVHLDLVASVPGSFTGPASSAYPYYNDDEKAWDGGLEVEITR